VSAPSHTISYSSAQLIIQRLLYVNQQHEPDATSLPLHPSLHPSTPSWTVKPVTMKQSPTHPSVSRSSQKPASKRTLGSQQHQALEAKLLTSFCKVKPLTVEAAEIIHLINNMESDLHKLPVRRQIALVYKVFQHFWLKSLGKLYD
jgi:hypothetical protein